jgi:hypothetical protein
MDEGIDSYYEFRYDANKYRYIPLLSNIIPEQFRQKSAQDFLAAVYNVFSIMPMKNFPVESPSGAFINEQDYADVVYFKTAEWMYILQLTLGDEKFQRGMQAYYKDWKFKHPYPEDMKISLENSTNIGLNNVFSLLQKKGNLK